MGRSAGDQTLRCTDPAVCRQRGTLSADGGEAAEGVPGPCAFRVSMLLHIWSSDTVHMRWLLEDQSGSTDPMLRNTRWITWYFLTPSCRLSPLISLVLTCTVAVTLVFPSVTCPKYGRDRQSMFHNRAAIYS